MFDKINLLFQAGTIEDDRDSIVLQTICKLVEKKRDEWPAIANVPVTDYCLGVSIDEVYAALPLTMVDSNTTKPALNITQLIQSIDRLVVQFLFLRNPDEYEVLHLHPQLMRNLQRSTEQESKMEGFFDLIKNGFRPSPTA